MKYKYMKLLATFFIFVVSSVTTVTIRSQHHNTHNIHHTRKIKRTTNGNPHSKPIVRSISQNNDLLNEGVAALSYHRSFVPDVSFLSQVEDMPTEEKIISANNTNETEHQTKKNNVATILKQVVNNDSVRLRNTPSVDYSKWVKPESHSISVDSQNSPSITYGEYNSTNSTHDHVHISHFSCESIEQSKCVYEQVSLLCPSKCSNNTINQNNTLSNTNIEPKIGANTLYNSTTSPLNSFNQTQVESSQTHVDSKNPISHQYNQVPTYENSKEYELVSPPLYINNENITYDPNSRLMETYANYNNNISKIVDDNDNTNHNHNNNNNNNNIPINNVVSHPTGYINQDISTTIPPNIPSTSYDNYLKPHVDQAEIKTLTPSMELSSQDNQPIRTNNIQDILSDSFYILAGVVDRTTKGFYLKNFGKNINESSSNDNSDNNINMDLNKDPDLCLQYNLNNCSDPYVSDLCPQLCKYCTPWVATTKCSVVCGKGVQPAQRHCTFPNGTQIIEFNYIFCLNIPCNSTCRILSNWGPCLKDINGVSVRIKNCTLKDGSTRIYYEHRVCNEETKPNIDLYSKLSTRFFETPTGNNNFNRYKPQSIKLKLAAYISFDKFRDDINVIFDEKDENNDLSIQNVKLFDGNFTCGFGALFTNYDSIMVFNDNIFRNFVEKSFSFLIWIFPKSGPRSERTQTIFQFISNDNQFGTHTLDLTYDSKLEWTHYDLYTKKIITKKSSIILKKDKWSHIAFIYKLNPLYIKIYVDSIESILHDNSNTNMSSMAQPRLPKGSIGSFQSIGNNINLDQPFYGIFDELYIFKKPINSTVITNVADTCRFRTKRGCPSPLLGFCPDCPACDELNGVISDDNNFDNEENLPYVTINPPTIS